MSYILSCCSTSDLDLSVYQKQDIQYIYFHYFINGEEHYDDFGKSIPFDKFYKMMAEGAVTKTSQINTKEFINYFEPFLKEGKDILHVCLSSGLSGVINSANGAKEILLEKYPERKIYIIDSLAASSGYGLLMYRLSMLKNEGKSIDEIKDYCEQHKLEVNHWFFSTDLSFYVKGGRISKTSGFVGTLLKICPLLNVDYLGRLIPREKIRTKKKVIQEIVKKMEENADDGLNYNQEVFISQSNCYEDALEVKNLIESKFPNTKGKISIFNIGTTIGSHTGPGTVALFFWGKKRIN